MKVIMPVDGEEGERSEATESVEDGREEEGNHQATAKTNEGDDAIVEYTFEQAVEHIGFGKFHYILTILCGVGYFAEITELVVVSFVAPAIQNEMGLSAPEYGLLGSSSFIGMAIGALFWGHIGDALGRRLSFNLTVWLTFLGGFLSAFSPNYGVLLFFRLMTAFGIGGMLPVDYTVFLEFLPSKKRGSHIVTVDAMGVIPALLLSSGLVYAFSSSNHIAWRWVLGTSSIPSGIMAVLRSRVPESPRFHLSRNNVEKAQEILERVAKTNKVDLPGNKLLPLSATCPAKPSLSIEIPHSEDVTKSSISHLEIEGANIPPKIESGHAFGQLFAGKELRATTLRLWSLYFLIQFSSAGMVFALPLIMKESYAVTDRRVAEDLIWGVIGVLPGLTIAFFVVEISRKYSLAGFAISASLSVVFLSLTTLFWGNQVGAIIISMILRGSMEGCFATLNTAAVESYPTDCRASGIGTAQIFDHIAGSISPLIFSVLNASESTRPYVFVIYAAAYMLAAIPAATLPTDYAGKTVHDKTNK